MKFNSWSKKRIKEGTKIFTSRKRKYEGDPDVYDIVGPLPWWFIRNYLYKYEGARNSTELQRIINQIFRRHVDPWEMFYVHILNDECTSKYVKEKKGLAN